MKQVILFSAVILSFILKKKISIFGISPDLIAAAVYYAGLHTSTSKGLLIGSLAGSVEDSLAGDMLGSNLLGKGLIGFFSPMAAGSLFIWTPLSGMLSMFALTVLSGSVVFLIKAAYGAAPAPLPDALIILLAQGMFNSAIGFFLRPENAE